MSKGYWDAEDTEVLRQETPAYVGGLEKSKLLIKYTTVKWVLFWALDGNEYLKGILDKSKNARGLLPGTKLERDFLAKYNVPPDIGHSELVSKYMDIRQDFLDTDEEFLRLRSEVQSKM